jgi:HK97 gp10 family phage protein
MATKIVIDKSFYAECRARGRHLLEKVAKAVAEDARDIVPYDTGRLHSRISHRVMSSRRARISAKTHYAVYVELGTRYMRAQPYLRPALYQVRVGAWGVR